MMVENHSGGCQCGAVRYRVTGPLAEPHICHCRMCQKAAGNYFMPLGGVERSRIEFTRGEPSWFHSSEPVRRGFCNKCGTPLLFDALGSDHVAVTLGSLDRPAEIEPVWQYGTEARVPWFARLAGLAGETTEEAENQDGVDIGHVRASNQQHPDHDTLHWGTESEP